MTESYKYLVANILKFILFWVCIAIVMLLYAPGPSPLFPDYSFDFAIFKTMGEIWRDGGLPYRDFFDHKGPIHYLVYTIALSIAPGKLGILLLFSLLNAISLYFSYLIVKHLTSNKYLIAAAIVLFLITLANYTEGGATVEELSLPFQIIPLFLSIKFFKNRSLDLRIPALICGLCFALVALIRINNNCILCGCGIAIIWMLVQEKRYKELLSTILFFLLGCFIICLPCIFYFQSKGILDDVIFGTFTFNFDYRSKWDGNKDWRDYCYNSSFLLPCFILPVAGWCYKQKNSLNFIVLCISVSVITFLTFYNSNGFKHYFLLVIPIVIFCIGLCQGLQLWKRLSIVGLLIFPFVIRANQFATRHAFNYTPGISANYKLINKIPGHDLDSVYNYGNYYGILWLDVKGHKPVGRFSFLQGRLARINDRIEKEIECAFVASNPKWIISSFPINTMYPMENLDRRYEVIDSLVGSVDEGTTRLYKRIE